MISSMGSVTRADWSSSKGGGRVSACGACGRVSPRPVCTVSVRAGRRGRRGRHYTSVSSTGRGCQQHLSTTRGSTPHSTPSYVRSPSFTTAAGQIWHGHVPRRTMTSFLFLNGVATSVADVILRVHVTIVTSSSHWREFGHAVRGSAYW